MRVVVFSLMVVLSVSSWAEAKSEYALIMEALDPTSKYKMKMSHTQMCLRAWRLRRKENRKLTKYAKIAEKTGQSKYRNIARGHAVRYLNLKHHMKKRGCYAALQRYWRRRKRSKIRRKKKAQQSIKKKLEQRLKKKVRRLQRKSEISRRAKPPQRKGVFAQKKKPRVQKSKEELTMNERIMGWLFWLAVLVSLFLYFTQGIRRRKRLMKKYNDKNLVSKLMRKMYWQGMTKEMVIDSLGYPQNKTTSVLKTKTKQTWKYGKVAKDRYRLHILFEDGEVVGWEEK